MKKKNIFISAITLLLLSGCTNPVRTLPDNLTPSVNSMSSLTTSDVHETSSSAAQTSIDKMMTPSNKLVLSKTDVSPISATQDTLSDSFYKIVETPRKRGTEGEKRVSDYIQAELQNSGYTVSREEFDIYESSLAVFAKNDFFNLNPNSTPSIAIGQNIIAKLGTDKNKKTLVISAHYDSTEGSVGALDNGSGTAILLELARNLSNENFDYNVTFAFFSGEEYRMFGSRSYLNSLSDDELQNIAGCFNIDMAGSKNWRKIIVETASGTDNWITTQFGEICSEAKLRKGAASDEVSFSKKDIPAMRFTSTNNHDKRFDSSLLAKEETAESVSIENLRKDYNIIYDFIKTLDIFLAM